MKILHVISSLEIGGAQRIVHDLALSQISSGNNVSVIVYNFSESILEQQLIAAGATVISLKLQNIYSFGSIIKLHKIIKGYDIIHVHLFPSLYHVAFASIGTKAHIVYTEHSTYNRRRSKKFLKPIEKFIYNRYCCIVSISQSTQSALTKWLRPKDSSKFHIIHNGIDFNSYYNAPTKSIEDLFGRSGIPILMISRFVPSKDQCTLIKAIRLINNPNVFIAFAGDGDLIERAKLLSKELGVSDKCVFLGNRNDIPLLIKASSIGVQSSHWEGFGLTALEFMAAGKPVVASSVDGLKQVVGGAGEIFNTADEISLAEKINTLLIDSKYYKSVVSKCIIRAKEYDISIMAHEYNNIYESLYNM